jgi:hypothetical protein
MRFESQIAVNIKITVSWAVMVLDEIMVASILDDSAAFMFYTVNAVAGSSRMLVTYQMNVVQCLRGLQS